MFAVNTVTHGTKNLYHLARASWLSLYNRDKASKALMQSPAATMGWEGASSFAPEVDMLMGGGLTLDIGPQYAMKVDWNSGWRTTWLEKAVGKMSPEAAEWMAKARTSSSDWLFSRLGTSLKMYVALTEFRHLKVKHAEDLRKGRTSEAKLAGLVAEEVNDDFGGLNYKRGKHLMGGARSAFAQMLMRLTFLAPDWTESNLNTILKGIRGSRSTAILPGMTEEQQAEQRLLRGIQKRMYRNLYMQALVRSQMVTVVFNAIMAGLDDEETLFSIYEKAFESSFKDAAYGFIPRRFNFLEADITPLAKFIDNMTGLTGSPKHGDSRVYFSVLGHFLDGAKWLSAMANRDLTAPVKAKLGPIARLAMAFESGEDWRGMAYQPVDELLQEDHDRWRLSLTGWEFGSQGLDLEDVPAFAIDQVNSVMPIFFQGGVRLIAGEESLFDFMADAFGFHVSRDYGNRGGGSASRAAFIMGGS